MPQLMTNQASVVGGGDFEVMGSGTHANLDIIAPAGSANLNLKVGTASSTGATLVGIIQWLILIKKSK